MTTTPTQSRILTPRERAILDLLADGRQSREIAQSFAISSSTVHKHLQNIYEKLGVRNRIEALKEAGIMPSAMPPSPQGRSVSLFYAHIEDARGERLHDDIRSLTRQVIARMHAGETLCVTITILSAQEVCP